MAAPPTQHAVSAATSGNDDTITIHHNTSSTISHGSSHYNIPTAQTTGSPQHAAISAAQQLISTTSPPPPDPRTILHTTSATTGNKGNLSGRNGRNGNHVQVHPSSSSSLGSTPIPPSPSPLLAHHLMLSPNNISPASPTLPPASPMSPISPIPASKDTIKLLEKSSHINKSDNHSAAAATEVTKNGKPHHNNDKEVPTIVPSAPALNNTNQTATIAEASAKAAAATAGGGICCHAKCPSRRSCRTWWKLFLPSFVGVATVAVLVYLWRAQTEASEALATQKSAMNNVISITLGKLLFVAGDLRIIADAATGSCAGARPYNAPPVQCSFSALASAVPSFLAYRGYNYIRLLNATGYEQTTGYYNRTSGTATLLPKSQLRDLSLAPQWKKLHQTPIGQVSVTAIADVRPIVPINSVAAPSWFLSVNVKNSLGQLAGSVGIDYNIDEFLNYISDSGMMLVNTNGYFLAGAPDGISNSGFSYNTTDPRYSYTFQSIWSSEWGRMVSQMTSDTDSTFNYTTSTANTRLTDIKSMGSIYNFKTKSGSFVYSDLCWSFLLGPAVPIASTCPNDTNLRFFLVSFVPSTQLSPDAVRFSTFIWIAGGILMLGWGLIAARLTRTANERALAEEEAAYNRKLADQALSTQRLVVGPMAKLAAHLDMQRHKKQAPKVTTIVAAIPAATLPAPATPTRAAAAAANTRSAPGGTATGEEKDVKPTGNEVVAIVNTEPRVLTAGDIPALGSLDTLLEDEFCSRYFNSFLLREWTSENLLFYNDVRAFRSTMSEAAELIYNLYVADHADFQVNIPSRGAATIASSLTSPHATMFDEAQAEVKRLLVQNSFPRFFESDICSDMMAEINRKAQMGRHYDSSEGSKRSSGKGSGAGGNSRPVGADTGEPSRHSAGGVTVVVSGTGPAGVTSPPTQSRVGVSGGISSQAQAAQRLSHQKAVASAFTRASTGSDYPESPTAGSDRAAIDRVSAPPSALLHAMSPPLGPMSPMTPLAPPARENSPVNNIHNRQRSSPVPVSSTPQTSHGRPPLQTTVPPQNNPESPTVRPHTATHAAITMAAAATSTTTPASKVLASSSSSDIHASTPINAPTTGTSNTAHSLKNHPSAGGGSSNNVVIMVDRRSPSPHSRRHLMYAVQQRKRENAAAGGTSGNGSTVPTLGSRHQSFDGPDNVTTISDGPSTPAGASLPLPLSSTSPSHSHTVNVHGDKGVSSHATMAVSASSVTMMTSATPPVTVTTSGSAPTSMPSLPGALNEQSPTSSSGLPILKRKSSLPPMTSTNATNHSPFTSLADASHQ